MRVSRTSFFFHFLFFPTNLYLLSGSHLILLQSSTPFSCRGQQHNKPGRGDSGGFGGGI
jgi:hypothetical protein